MGAGAGRWDGVGVAQIGQGDGVPVSGLARVAVRAVGRWRWCAVVCVLLVFLVWGAPRALAAPAFAPVAGSPFATGTTPVSVAFSPGGGLLATANLNASTVSVFAVGSGGALTPVAGSPFVTGNGPASVAFSPGGGLLATANAGRQHGVGVRGRGGRRVDPGRGLAVRDRQRPGVGCVQSGWRAARDRQRKRQHGVGVRGRVRRGVDPGRGLAVRGRGPPGARLRSVRVAGCSRPPTKPAARCRCSRSGPAAR